MVAEVSVTRKAMATIPEGWNSDGEDSAGADAIATAMWPQMLAFRNKTQSCFGFDCGAAGGGGAGGKGSNDHDSVR